MKLEIPEPQREKFERLFMDSGYRAREELFEEMMSLLDSVYAARREGYDTLIVKKSGTEVHKIIVRKYGDKIRN